MSTRICVWGSNSFSGAHFVRHALERGFDVTGISRSQEPHAVFLPYLESGGRRPERFTFVQADLNRDMDTVLACMEQEQPAYIVNFAAQGMVAESWQNPEQWLRTNAQAPLLFCQHLRKATWLRKFVQISTPEVYGATEGTVQESVYYRPSTPYAVSKAAADMSLMCFFKAYGFPVAFTRAANVYGPGQQLYRIIPRAVLRLLRGETLDLHGGGVSQRSFVHIADVADATLRVMLHGEPGEIYHIATERMVSIRDLVFLIAQKLGVDAEKHVRIVGDRLGKDAAYMLDSSHIRQCLGWRETYSLDQGVDEVVLWVRRNLALLSTLPQDYQHKV